MPASVPTLQIAVASSFTAEPISPVLGGWFERSGHSVRMLHAPFNQVIQQLLDPSSLLASNRGGVNIVLVRARDLAVDSGSRASEAAREVAAALAASAGRDRIPLLVCVCPEPSGDEVAEVFAADLAGQLAGVAGVEVLAAADLAKLYPVESPFDPESDEVARVPYSEPMFAALATWLARRVMALRRRPFKVIAVDADNTLWSGVCGEVGPQGVVVDAGRREFQQLLLEKRAEGFLLCLVSKNHPEDVEAVFREHPDMLLPRSAFADVAVNWEPKSDNLRAIAGRLNLGLESFVFLDDNPAEIAEVAANAPAVLAVRVPEDATALAGFARHLWVLDHARVTGDDAKRADFYQDEARRNELLSKAASFEDFIGSLELVIEFDALTADDAARASQLTQRTNQFNAAPLPRDESSMLESCRGMSPELVRVRDRFGDYGTVGLILSREDSGSLCVETFLLSCRALGKGVEHRMLRRLGEIALERGLGEVAIRYHDSGRNQPCRAFLESIAEGRWENGLRMIPAAAAANCRLQASARAAEISANEVSVPGEDPAWVTRCAGDLSSVSAILAEMRDAARPRPELGEPYVAPQGVAERVVAAVWCEVLGLETAGRNDRFTDLGGTSLHLVRVHAALQRRFGRRFDLVRLFEHPTLAAQALLAAGNEAVGNADESSANPQTGTASGAVAIIGMAVRLPGASTPEELWQNLRDGVESITHFDPSELEVPAANGEALVCARGLLEPELFEGLDGGLFGIVPREAEMIDPQQRVFLEICWEAIERAGYVPDDAEAEGGRIGVYAGCYYDTYLPHNILSDPEVHRRHLAEAQVGALQIEFGNDKDHLATRVAFKLNLRGPSLTVQTACSTSLVAVAHAMMALRTGQCEMALAGGITITVPQKRGFNHVEGGMLSPDGHCRPFDARSAGTVFSNGGGVVLLKRLEDAVRDGDHIHAVLRGFGLNNDGGVKHSYAAPSVDGQADVIRRAHLDAGVDPRTITCIEAHGTATPLGDPIEIAGLTDAFRRGTADRGFCAIGSLKSNLGHLDTAAGVCGLIKTALSLEHRELPPVLHFTAPNPRIDFANSPFFVNDRLRPWEAAPGSPRRAGVSSFGVGGTNAHVIVEEAPPSALPAERSGSIDRVLVFSGRDEAALDQLAGRLAAHATQAAEEDFAVAARTLALGRKAMNRRAAVVAGSWSEAAAAFSAADRVSASAQSGVAGLVWTFPGQGAQHPGMTADLYATEPGFRADIDRCAELLRSELGGDLRDALFAADGGEAAERLKHTVLAQPAIFVVEYAIARQWQRWGLSPELMLGHSVGEFTAACLAGVFSLEDGLRILAARGRLMGDVESGSMLSVRMPAADLRARLPEELDMAAENGPSLCVVAGDKEAVARFARELEADGVAVRELHTSHAFHSRMMDPVVGRFREVIATVALSAPRIPILSTVTGKLLTDSEATDPGYWAAHLRRTVLFNQAVDAAAGEKEGRIFLEVGPGQTLTVLARQTAGRRAAACLPSCEHPAAEASDRRRMLTTLAELWCRGCEVDWAAVHAETPRRRVALPTYPFQRRRAWLPCRLLDLPLPSTPVTVASDAALDEPSSEAVAPAAAPSDGTMERVCQALEDLSGIPASDMTPESGFLELGFDSLLLTQAARLLQNTFGVAISFRDLMQTMPTVGALVAHLERNGVVASAPAAAAASAPRPVAQAAAPAAGPEPESGVSGPRTRIDRTSTTAELTPVQREHLDELTRRYNSRTKGSKELTQQNRQWLADPRTVNGFNRLWKEMVYQIVARRMKGCKMWDVDGNEYIDMVNGFGPNFLGHSPDYVSDAIREQLATGLEIGPQCEAAMETAKLFCEVTGNERVCFLNTGSEAVQAAMRIARTVTGRDKVLVFDKDYHGNFDPVLVRSVGSGARRRTLPLAPGIPASAVQDVIVVPWGKPEALDMIREVAGELAAVLVEPVQSRQPEWIPVDFVHDVQRLSKEHGFLLVFDEVITGLRQGLHGAQEMYEIKPDLATYGKVFGGGALPIGVIAGKAEYMDTFDGGQWQYGDDSFPEKEVTFFAGTFVRLPLAMAACRAVLTHLKDKGPEYWGDIATRATRLATSVDRMFRDNGIDVRMVNTGSQMYLRIGDGAKHGNLIFYHLREKGVFAMEGLPFYLTAEHTDADVDLVIDAFRRTIAELQDGGFFPKPPRPEGVEAPAGARGPFPMTEPMVEIHLAAMLGNEANLAFNEMLQLRLKGPLDEAALRAALQDLVDRHDALRMRIPAGHGTGFVIDSTREVMILSEDFRGQPDPERLLVESGLRQREAAFDLSEGPLFRVVVARLSEEEAALQFAAHHIACDGWSFEVMIRDFASCYEARKRGRRPLLPPPPSIVDRALREASQGSSDEAALAWWSERFAGGVTELELPLRRSYGTVPDYASATCERVLDRPQVDRLRKLAGGCGVTLNSALLAGFQAFLHRLSGQEEFVIAFPSAGQMEHGDEKLVGHCVNFLPLPASVKSGVSFKELASRVSGEQFDALEHGKVTYGRLVRELKVRRDGGRRPLVEYIFNFEPSGDPGSFGGLDSKVETVPARYSNSTIFLNAMQTPDGLVLSSTYNRTLVDPGTMRSWLDGYANLLLAAAGNPIGAVGDLDLMDDAGRAELVAWGEGADVAVSASVADVFRQACDAHAARTALVWNQGSWTYAELGKRVASYAAALGGRGVKAGDRVAVCLKRGPEAIAALLGVLEAGACYVPMDPEWPDSRITEILEEAKVGVWIAGADAPVAGVSTVNEVTVIEGVLPPPVPRGPDDPAYVMFTSGSTGKPKGVVVPQRGILRLTRGADYCDFGPEEVFLQGSTLAFDAATFEIFGALLNGGKLVLPGQDPALETLARMTREHGVTTLWLTAGLFELMVEEHLDDLVHIRQLLTGGESPSIEHLRRAASALPGTRLINGYGPTENTTFTCCHTVRDADLNSRILPIGKPIAGTRVRIVDPQGQLVPVGCPGELQCGGAGLGLGYLEDAGLTSERFIDGGRWYRSGDLCRWTSEGLVEFLGRIDDQVKVRGFRIEPGEIEAALAAHPDVRQCKVAVRGSGAAGKRLLAWYVPAEGAKAGRGEIRAWLGERLPSFMLPDGIEVLAAMPLNANGKVDVRALPDPHSHPVEQAKAEPPTGASEEKLAAIWRDILGVDGIGRDDEFFDLGGNSLAGLRMFARIGKEFGVSLPLATLLQARTIRHLARVIETGSLPEAAVTTQDTGHIATIRSGGGLPPLVAIHGGDGGILFYEELARRLPEDRPFLAIESPDLSTSGEINVASIEVTARNYIGLLKKVRPQGPYLLTGYSFGGVVAYEMAAQLSADGEEVGFLGLIDTLNPAVPIREYSLPERVSVFWKSHGEEPLLDRIQSLAVRFREGVGTNLRVKAEVAAANSGPAEAHSELRGVQLREAHYQAMLAYTPKTYDGRVTLFRASKKSDKFDFPADYGWQGLATDFRIVDVPGDHLTVFDRENIPALASRFGTALPGQPPAG